MQGYRTHIARFGDCLRLKFIFQRFLIAFLFFISFDDAIAQKKDCPYVLQIRIIKAESQRFVGQKNSPIEGVEIFIEKSHSISHTDADGWALIRGLCDSISEVEINVANKHHHLPLKSKSLINNITRGYYLITLSDSFAKAEWQDEQLLGDSAIEKMGPAHLHAKSRSQGDVMHKPKFYLSPQQNLSKMLESLPMTQTLSTGMGIGKPVVQGMFGQRLPILNNGFRMEGQTWGLDHAPETDAWSVQTVNLIRGTDALAVGADAWGNAINLINQYDFHQFNREYTQLASFQSNGRGIQLGGKYIKGRSNVKPGKHPYEKGQYFLYSARIIGNYSIPTQTLKNTATREASLSYGNSWNSQRGYWRLIPAVSNREIHIKAYAFQGAIFAESHIGNINDLLAAIQRTTPLYDAPFTYKISNPQQQTYQAQVGYNSYNRVLAKLIIHHKICLQSNLRLEYDPHRNSSINFAQLNLWQGTISQYTGIEKINQSHWKKRIVIQNTSQWQRYAGYYFLPDYKQWQPNVHLYFGNKSNPRAEHELIVRTDWLIRNVLPKIDGVTTNIWQHHLGFSAAYSFHHTAGRHEFQLHLSQLWRAPSVNELYTQGVHHGAAAYEQGNGQLKPESGEKLELGYILALRNAQFNFTAFGQYSANFISLFPMSAPVLTVRGTFPGYEYKQLPTIYSGLEASSLIFLRPLKMQIFTRIGALYGRILTLQTDARYPNFLPCPKASIQFQKHWKHMLLNIDIQATGKQPFYTPGTDFLPPPNGYVLVNSQLHLFDYGFRQRSKWVIYGENIGNKAYRDYMDRFRYFTNQPGTNVGVKWIYNIHHHNEHNHKANKS
jgi:iron complex outermembrane receptor protein